MRLGIAGVLVLCAPAMGADAEKCTIAFNLGAATWIGDPTQRQSCDSGSVDLAPDDLGLTIHPSSRGAWQLYER
jgi:hypothetical protein